MENTTSEVETKVELFQEIDCLLLQVENLKLQLKWAEQRNQQLRTKLARYENTLGIAEAA